MNRAIAFPPGLRLGPGEAHVWYVFPERLALGAAARASAMLPPDELARSLEMKHEGRRGEFLLGRVLLRSMLSAYVPAIAPGAWQFVLESHGKPCVVSPAPGRAYAVNLSHCAGLIAVAIAAGGELGVDVENRDRRTDHERLAESVFSADERGAVLALTGAARVRRFFEFWTLKEAYIKARGLGLSIPLESFAFTVQADRRITVAFASEAGDPGGDWRFELFEPGPHHQLGTAYRPAEAGEVTLRIRELGPA